MILEQIRYFVDDDNRDAFLQARRELSSIRGQAGIPAGRLLLADPVPDDGPFLMWQCTYVDEAQMGIAETRLMNNAEYESARSRLGDLVARVELEFYTIEDDGDEE